MVEMEDDEVGDGDLKEDAGVGEEAEEHGQEFFEIVQGHEGEGRIGDNIAEIGDDGVSKEDVVETSPVKARQAGDSVPGGGDVEIDIEEKEKVGEECLGGIEGVPNAVQV